MVVIKNLIVMGVFGLGYVSLKNAMSRRPVYSGRVAERTELIAWNATLMDCLEQLSQIATEDEIVHLLDSVARIREISTSRARASLNDLQRLIAATSSEFTRVAGRSRGGMTLDQIRVQNALIEDVSPVVHEIFENIQHNHMLDTLGP